MNKEYAEEMCRKLSKALSQATEALAPLPRTERMRVISALAADIASKASLDDRAQQRVLAEIFLDSMECLAYDALGEKLRGISSMLEESLAKEKSTRQ